MVDARITRRRVLGAGAAVVAGAAVGPTVVGASTRSPATKFDGLSPIRPELYSMVSSTWPLLGVIEQAEMCLGQALVANNGALMMVGAPYWGVYNAGSGQIGTSFLLPIGSVITGIDFCLYGTPITGVVNVSRYRPDGAGYDALINNFPLDNTTMGVQVVSMTIGAGADGTTAYYASFTGGSATSTVRAIRVRHIPPSQGFVSVSPTRVYDSRLPMAPAVSGPLSSGQSRTISIADGRDTDTGAVTATSLVPVSAGAIAYTLTVADTTGAGFIAINPGGTTTVSASTINWSQSGQALANTTIVEVSPLRTITAIAGGGGSADFVIDIVGWFI